jgi:tetratricopeptide (TPR) repeat protein
MTKRARAVAILIVALLAVWLGVSVRTPAPPDRIAVVDAPLLGMGPRIVSPGRHLLPRGLFWIATYPRGARKLRIDLTGGNAAHSREGSKIEAEVALDYTIAPERVLDLHRAHGPDYETVWLTHLMRLAAADRIAAVSYDVVRNRDPELPQSVRGVVAKEIEAVGITIGSLRMTQVAGVGESGGAIVRAGVEPIDREVVLIGVDSFTWRIIDPLMASGRMPNLRRLVERGARANLRTITPILSPVVWTSIATGARPSRHGIVDFVVTARDSGRIVPVTSAMRLVPALWNILSRQEVDTDVVGWWATWPAETVRGRIVTDRVAFQLFDAETQDWKNDDPAATRGKTYPPDLFTTIRPLIKAPSEVDDAAIAALVGGGRLPREPTAEQADLLRRMRTIVAAGQTYHAIGRGLVRDARHGLKMLYYEGPDTISHLLMRYRPPLMPGVPAGDAALFGPAVDRYYAIQDTYIGEIVDAAGPDATFILCSDHGFKSDSNRPIDSDPRIDRGRAAEWHTPVGVLVMAGPDVRPGVDLGAASVLDVAPTVLALFGLPAARDMDGQPLAEALTREFLAKHPVAWIDTYGGQRSPDTGDGLAVSAGDAEVIQKLRSIGYIGEERLEARNNRGLIALDEGDVDGAIAQFEGALAKGSAGPEMRLNLARAWLQKGDAARTRALTSEILAQDARNKQALVLLAGAAIKENKYGEAEENLRRALRVDPSFALAHTKLGEVLQKEGRDDEALAELLESVAIAPLSPVEYNAIGNIHRRHGRFDAAIEAYRDALRADPQYIGAYNNLGLCLQERGRLAEAEALYAKGLAIRPENAVLRNSMATLRSAQGNREAALTEVDRALAASPDWPVAQGNKATLLFAMGRIAEAKEAFARWVALEPDNLEGRLGYALTLLATRDPDAAIAQLHEVIHRDPANLRAHVALGETFLKKGDLGRARTELEAAVGSGEPVARAWNSLAEVYTRLGLRPEAAAALRRSLSIEPDQPEVRARLASAGG